MRLKLNINHVEHETEAEPGDTLLKVLRQLGYFGVKHGCETGECGVCSILWDGKPVNSCVILASQAEGHTIETIESIGQPAQQGWKTTEGLHRLQEAFIQVGAVQCGYCTPAMILAAKELLSRNPNPTETDVRDALSGVLCRCTGYIKPVQAVLQAAAKMRGEAGSEIDSTPKMVVVPQTKEWTTVGHSEPKVDGIKLVQGKPAFALDFDRRGMLYAKVLHSPLAHARIKSINTQKAKELAGVAAILTWQDIPRVVYSTAGQSDPIPGPLDTFSLDNKVRFVGDRVAFVAAETEAIAELALSMIEVEYEPLPVLHDPSQAMQPGAPVLHDEPEYKNFDKSDPKQNLAAKIRIDIGDVEQGFSEADFVVEGVYEVSKVQQAHLEPHAVITYWDEDDRLVIRTSTQVPFHARRILAPVLGLPIKRIRVIKPRIGGGFGGKQEILIEDVAAHLTIATGRPVSYEYTREEEFTASRSRHPMRIHMKTGVKRDGTITANAMVALSDTGAYGCHALTVTGNTGHKSMALYVGNEKYRQSPNIRFYADIVYTNHSPAGAFRGYGVPQGFWPVERHMDKIAKKLGMDPIEFRLKNTLRAGEMHPFSTAWSEGREPKPEKIETCGLSECTRQGMTAIGWDQKFGNDHWHSGINGLRKGIGVALVMQGTAIPYLDMGAASLKMNEDGSFNLLIGATDLGTGSDTVLAQMAAEVLGIPVEDIIVYSSDTDFTPFDKGAYASSTTYISGAAVVKAAQKCADRIRERAVLIFEERASNGVNKKSGVMNSNPRSSPTQPSSYPLQDLKLFGRAVVAPGGERVSLCEIAQHAFHKTNQEQIMATASFMSPVSPPPFAAQFAEVSVDIETGMVMVDRLVIAVDSGVIINPLTASGQIEGGMTQALGYAVCEEMRYDEKGNIREKDFRDYHIFQANEMPAMETIFVETFEPSHPYGVKATAEIPMDGVAPAIGNAVFDACGVQIDEIPITPERVWRALKGFGGEEDRRRETGDRSSVFSNG